jgi:hypothetical protein
LNADGSVNQTVTVPLFWQRLNPATGPIGTNRSDVNSTYNGLIITLRKPATHGFRNPGQLHVEQGRPTTANRVPTTAPAEPD